ncbi:hypothetical protein EPUS_06015 [Endocarpon pusillum Z07020]|uniref:Survival motor neuron Tudor domain-containing protein n=1 Tax=Endocarpon pusillum (strain Z07020 / HMAS-L-300199) TaxID=1263415 RepID=U1GHC8_ENDPU|nr:uncharacterized protein EPUS_06015 [Endocarpon pusillum Z07020]ERF71186.1 hypothetical protein EPUS_06015 [Endocarpon pusillum Z07020]
MGKKRKREQLTQDEVWDDSALLKSWQDALDEYQFYHSIHAKGENVEDVLRQAESDDAAKNEDVVPAQSFNDPPSSDSALEDGEVDEHDTMTFSKKDTGQSGDNEPVRFAEAQNIEPPPTEKIAGSALASMDQDQILENIKMAYWWAGYYSALYDAKRTATEPSRK